MKLPSYLTINYKKDKIIYLDALYQTLHLLRDLTSSSIEVVLSPSTSQRCVTFKANRILKNVNEAEATLHEINNR